MKVRNKTANGRTIAATAVTVPAGGTVTVNKALGDALCLQVDVWEEVSTSKPKNDSEDS